MELTTEQYNRILRFLDADMSVEEIAAFKQELAANLEMRTQLDFEQSVRDVFEQKQVLFKNTEKPAMLISFKNRNSTFIAAATVLFIIAVTVLLFQKQKPDKNSTVINLDTVHLIKSDTVTVLNKTVDNYQATKAETLFRKYFEKDSLPEIYPMVIAEELNQYAIGNDAPIQQLNLSNLPETRGSSSQADKQTAQQLGHYFKGIAYLEKGSSQQAIINLQWVIKNSDNKQLTAKAEWYLALSYLKNDNNNEAEILLKKVSQNENNSTYSSKALRLLKSIKK